MDKSSQKIIIDQDTLFKKNVTICQNLDINQNMTINNSLSIPNTASITTSNIEFNKPTSISNLQISNTLAIGQQLTVQGDTNIQNNLTVINNVSILGDLTTTNQTNLNQLTITPPSTIQKSISNQILTIEGDTILDGNTTIQGDTIIQGNSLINSNTPSYFSVLPTSNRLPTIPIQLVTKQYVDNIDKISGATGPKGIDGITGAIGINGINGATGITGLIGHYYKTNGLSLQPIQISSIITQTSFTISSNLAWTPGQTAVIAYDSFNWLIAEVQNYSNTTITFNEPILRNFNNSTTYPIGTTFIINLEGFPSIEGPTGNQGPTGSLGPTGSKGSQGNTGNIGTTGIIGSTGPIGNTGPHGYFYKTNGTSSAINLNTLNTTSSFIVAAGLDYIPDLQVVTAVDSFNYFIATVISYSNTTLNLSIPLFKFTNQPDSFPSQTIWTINIDGAPGRQGPIGPSGPRGPAGITGLIGSIGNDGFNGPTGTTGGIGPTGFIGIFGPTGIPGPTGLIGDSFKTGGISPVPINLNTLNTQTTFTIQSNLDYTFGLRVVVAVDANNYFVAEVLSYIGTQLSLDVPSFKTTNQAGSFPISTVWIINIDGEPGRIGIIGKTGSTGITGIYGVTGITGSTGIYGPTGPTGSNGDSYKTTGFNSNGYVLTGLTGTTFQVEKNLAWTPGMVGVIAYNTSQYFIATVSNYNPTNNQLSFYNPIRIIGTGGPYYNFTINLDGIPGIIGNTGINGITGPTGPTGIIGPTGITGLTGSYGIIGKVGDLYKTNGITSNPININTLATPTLFSVSPYLAWQNGLSAVVAIDSFNYFISSVISYEQQNLILDTPLVKVTNVPYGLTGPWVINLDGAPGVRGPQGKTGVFGITGIFGATGLTGPTGIFGPTGSTGPNGINGIFGYFGPTGRRGDVYFSDSTSSETITLQSIITPTSFFGLEPNLAWTKGQEAVIAVDVNNFYVAAVENYNSVTNSIEFGIPVRQIGTNSYPSGTTWYINLDGIPGPQGFTGHTGFIGGTGVYGSTGATGTFGVFGPTGVTGKSGNLYKTFGHLYTPTPITIGSIGQQTLYVVDEGLSWENGLNAVVSRSDVVGEFYVAEVLSYGLGATGWQMVFDLPFSQTGTNTYSSGSGWVINLEGTPGPRGPAGPTGIGDAYIGSLTFSYSVSGTYSLVVPNGVQGMNVTLIGGGGGGGGGLLWNSGSYDLSGGGGGGGGAFNQGTFLLEDLNVTNGDILQITVGKGGLGGEGINGIINNGNPGNPGTSSTISKNGSVLLFSMPGQGGQGGVASFSETITQGGAGGTGFNLLPGNGGNGFYYTQQPLNTTNVGQPGGGGGGGYFLVSGALGVPNILDVSTNQVVGYLAYFGGTYFGASGNGGYITSASYDATPGTYGCGGGGGLSYLYSSTSATGNGGNGGDGYCSIRFF